MTSTAPVWGDSFFIELGRPSSDSLHAHGSGKLLLLKAFGHNDVTGIAFALLRRFRELVWIGVGLLCLAMMNCGHRSLRDSDVQDQSHRPLG
ncbi:MAG: hypothetical protein ABI980_01870 [Nitrospirota bacterium]